MYQTVDEIRKLIENDIAAVQRFLASLSIFKDVIIDLKDTHRKLTWDIDKKEIFLYAFMYRYEAMGLDMEDKLLIYPLLPQLIEECLNNSVIPQIDFVKIHEKIEEFTTNEEKNDKISSSPNQIFAPRYSLRDTQDGKGSKD